MRLLPLAGIALIILGTVILWKRPTYPTRRDVVEIGEFKASLQEQQTIPLWVGAAVIGTGVVCLLAGQRRRA
jgi:hypothetical protein